MAYQIIIDGTQVPSITWADPSLGAVHSLPSICRAFACREWPDSGRMKQLVTDYACRPILGTGKCRSAEDYVKGTRSGPRCSTCVCARKRPARHTRVWAECDQRERSARAGQNSRVLPSQVFIGLGIIVQCWRLHRLPRAMLVTVSPPVVNGAYQYRNSLQFVVCRHCRDPNLHWFRT